MHHSFHHVSCDDDPAENSWVRGTVCPSVCVHVCQCAPVVGAGSVRHCAVGLVWDQPVEALVSEESDLFPLRAHHIGASCVEVSQQHNVLHRVTAQPAFSTFCVCFLNMLSMFLYLFIYIHIGVPAVANISHHIMQSIHLPHSVVWRGVLRDQGEVPHSCKTERFTGGYGLPLEVCKRLTGHKS